VGFRLPLTNGSDHPARVVGCVRVYVKVDGKFTYLGWVNGIRDKRTFISSGPLLFLDVNGGDIGDEINVAKGETITVKARAVSRRPIGNLQIVSNGEIVKETIIEGKEGEIELKMPADKSRWFAARCSNSDTFEFLPNTIVQEDVAHTSGIYVLVDDKRIFDKKTAELFMKIVSAHATSIEKKALFDNNEQRQESVDVMARGAAVYEKMLTEYVD